MIQSLAREQERMLQAIWRPQPDPSGTPQPYHPRGLAAYRSNSHELAHRALAAAYPVVQQLLGDGNFAALARHCWLAHPPVRGDMAQWGGELAALVDELPDLSGQEPYLADVARCEWAMHCAASAANAPVDRASFALLTQCDPAQLALVLAPGTALVASPWAVASIVSGHLVAQPDLRAVARRLHQGSAETALVWRDGHVPRLRLAGAGEAPFIRALQGGTPLAGALQAACGLEFASWLAQAFESQLMVGVRAL